MTSDSERDEDSGLLRLCSITGLLVSGFLVVHVVVNAAAMQGAARFDDLTRRLQRTPALPLVEALLVLVPLVVHAGTAVLLWVRHGRVGAAPTTTDEPLRLRRITGVITLGFLAVHLYTLRLQVALGRMAPSDFFPTLCDTLSETVGAGIPVTAAIYLVGVSAASYHLASGIRHSFDTWGIARSTRGRRIAWAFGGALGILAFALSAATTVYYGTGSPWLGRASARPSE